MDIFEAINKRHSYRGEFEDKKIPQEDLKKIVQAGIQAPSGRNGQTTSFVIVDNEEILEKLREIVSSSAMQTAAAVIVAIANPEPNSSGTSFAKEDYSAAVENMLLAITAMGYASVWIDGALRRDQKAERIAKILGVTDGLDVSVVLPLGAPKETNEQKEKKPFDERAWFNGYKK